MANISQIQVSGVTYDIYDNSAIHSLAGYATTNDVTAATAALAEAIAQEGYQDATDVNNAITAATANYFDGAEYDSTSKRINFKHGATVKAYVDATPFIKDGMLDSVTIADRTIEGVLTTCLVFIWNTDAGKTETAIPLANLFDPSNFYNKTEVDDLLADKQDTLVSGTNIKTINNESILGTGNINIVTTVDSALSTTSTNPVQNAVVTNAINGKNQAISVNNTTLVIS